MNKLVLVVLSIAFLAYNIPSAFSAGAPCNSQNKCLRNSGKTKCCVTDTVSKNQTCETVTAALLTTTLETMQNVTGVAYFTKQLKSIVDGLKPNVPLELNSKICREYNRAQSLVAVGGLSSSIFGK